MPDTVYLRMCGRKRAYPLLSRETYLALFGLTPEEVYTSEELQRIQDVVQRSADENVASELGGRALHLKRRRSQQYLRKKRRRKGKKE